MLNIFTRKRELVEKPKRHNAKTCQDLFCEKRTCVPTAAQHKRIIKELRNDLRYARR